MKLYKSKWKLQQTMSHQNYHDTRYARSMDLLAPGTVSKRMTGKVKGLGPQGGGAQRGRVFNQG